MQMKNNIISISILVYYLQVWLVIIDVKLNL